MEVRKPLQPAFVCSAHSPYLSCERSRKLIKRFDPVIVSENGADHDEVAVPVRWTWPVFAGGCGESSSRHSASVTRKARRALDNDALPPIEWVGVRDGLALVIPHVGGAAEKAGWRAEIEPVEGQAKLVADQKGKLQSWKIKSPNASATPVGGWVLSSFPPNMRLILTGQCSPSTYTPSASGGLDAGEVDGSPAGSNGPGWPV